MLYNLGNDEGKQTDCGYGGKCAASNGEENVIGLCGNVTFVFTNGFYVVNQ